MAADPDLNHQVTLSPDGRTIEALCGAPSHPGQMLWTALHTVTANTCPGCVALLNLNWEPAR